MKTKEIRNFIKQSGEEGIIRLFEEQNELINQQSRDIKELALYFDKVVGITGNLVDGVANVRDTIERNQKKDDGLGGSTQSLDKD